jgi:branched-chain amino acid aminotransferase
LAHERGLDEFILLNERGQISECSSANVFCVQGTTVLTPPLETSGCLAGVTRAVLLEEVRVTGLTIRECDLAPADLERSDCVFITSTTRDLLPVLQIDGVKLQPDVDKLILLQQAFREYRAEYVRKQKNESRVLVA